MIRKVKQLLEGNSENHLMPFFWQHGEDEEMLREYMKVIDECGCKAVCVESRPHPDFCGDAKEKRQNLRTGKGASVNRRSIRISGKKRK